MSRSTDDSPACAVIAEPPPRLTESQAIESVRRHYGLEVTVRPLVSERDQNFRIETSDGRRFVLKIANAAEDPLVTDFQIEALLHIAAKADASLSVPEILPTNDGSSRYVLESDGARHVCRLVSYLPGVPLSGARLSAPLCRDLGAYLARLDQALGDFSHPGAARQHLLWDMKRAPDLRRLLPHVADGVTHRLLTETLDDFEAHALPVFDSLRWQVIHNDPNPGNVLVTAGAEPRVSGIIDFGDMLRSPLIVDVGVAASYLRVPDGDPLTLIVELLAGYHAVKPLTRTEIDLLHDLIRTRLAATVAILAWRESLRGADDAYLQDAARTEQTAREFLERLSELPRENAARIYRRVCASVTADG